MEANRLPIFTLLLLAVSLAPAWSNQLDPPMTGRPVPEFTQVDQTVKSLMVRYNLPGAALAIIDKQRLIYARGYGFSDSARRTPVMPYSKFRLASLSKAITAAAIMRLVEQGQLSLDQRIADILSEMKSTGGDSRALTITIRHALHHTSGWNRAVSGDPVFWYDSAQSRYGSVTTQSLAQVGFSSSLSASPGAEAAYSNLGYLLLGRIIERTTGRPYGQWITDNLFRPNGVGGLTLARTFERDAEPDEVKYEDYFGAPLMRSVVPGTVGFLPRPYGGSFMAEVLDSYGGWVGSAIDFGRLLTQLDGRNTPTIVSQSSWRSMMEPPGPPIPLQPVYLGKGWQVRSIDSRGWNWWSNGSLPGSSTFAVNYVSGRSYVLLFNSRPEDALINALASDVDTAMNAALDVVQAWPTFDLFVKRPPAVRLLSREVLGDTSAVRVQVTDPDGQSDLKVVHLLVGDEISPNNSCHAGYLFGSREVFLRGTDGAWQKAAAGSPIVLTNQHCSLDAGSFRTPSPTDEIIEFPLALASSFGGAKGIFVRTDDRGDLLDGWRREGNWWRNTPRPPSVGVLSPQNVFGSGSLRTVVTDADGDLRVIHILIGNAIVADGTCHVGYLVQTREVFVRSGSNWPRAVSGTPYRVDGPACSVDAQSATFDATGALSLSLTFASSFVGDKRVFIRGDDQGELTSGWREVGRWSSLARLPIFGAYSVQSIGGRSFSFLLRPSDPDGSENLWATHLLIGDDIVPQGTCHVGYLHASREIFLRQYDGQWLKTEAGGSAILGNPSCSLTASASGIDSSGALQLRLTFPSAINSRVFGLTEDFGGLRDGWRLLGAFSSN